MRPVCVQCQCEMRCSKTGATIVVMSGDEPYQIWQADIFQCPGCGFEAVTGWAGKPFKYRHEENFQQAVEGYRRQKCERVEYVYEKPTPRKSGMLTEKKEGEI